MSFGGVGSTGPLGGGANREVRELQEELREEKAEEWVREHPDGPPPKRHPVRKLWDALRGRSHGGGD